MNSLYREEILEHYREPLNYGKLSFFTVSSKQTNPFCGDEVEVFIDMQKGSVKDIGFLGTGCAISIASTSILSGFAKGKTKKELTKFSQEDMLGLLGIEVSETRKKCALLGFSTFKDCLESEKRKAQSAK